MPSARDGGAISLRWNCENQIDQEESLFADYILIYVAFPYGTLGIDHVNLSVSMIITNDLIFQS